MAFAMIYVRVYLKRNQIILFCSITREKNSFNSKKIGSLIDKKSRVLMVILKNQTLVSIKKKNKKCECIRAFILRLGSYFT